MSQDKNNNPKAYYNSPYDPNVLDDDPGSSASVPPVPPPPYSPYNPNATPSAPPSAPPSEHAGSSPHPPPSVINPLPYSPGFPHQSYGAVPVSSDADLPPPTNDPRLGFYFRPPDPRFYFRPPDDASGNEQRHPWSFRFPHNPPPDDASGNEQRHPWGFRFPHNPFGGFRGRPVHPHQGPFPYFPQFPHFPHMASTPPMPVPDFDNASSHDPLLGHYGRGRGGRGGRGRGRGRDHNSHRRRSSSPSSSSDRRKPCCGSWCLYLCVGILILIMLFRLLFDFKIDDGGIGWDCKGENGLRWEAIPEQTIFNVKDTKSLKFVHTGALSSGRLTITRSLDSMNPYGSLTSKVTISSRDLSKRMKYEFGIGEGASVYGFYFETPEHLAWNECIRVELTLVVPRSWPDASLLIFQLRGFEILVHNLAEVGKEENTGVKFDFVRLATTNYPITVEGSIVARTGLALATTNAPIRVHGSLKSNNYIQITSSNAALDLHATSSRILILKTTNGKIMGNHTAFDSLECETSNGHIDLQSARAPIIELKTTNANIVAGGVEVGNKLEAISSNGKVDVDIVKWVDGWSGEGVTVVARSSNGPVKVIMPHNYRGSFSVSTSNDKALVGFVPNLMEGALPNSAVENANTTVADADPMASDLHWDISRSDRKDGWKGESEDSRGLGNIAVKTTSSKAEVWFRG